MRSGALSGRRASGAQRGGMRARSSLLLLLLLAAAAVALADDNVTVVRKTLELEQEYTLLVDRSVEYILQFVPSLEQSVFPTRVWFRSEGGDVTRPLLLTARQRTGAITWQLPYQAGEALQYELQRTLCPDDALDAAVDSDCVGPGEIVRRGEWSLHVATSCAAPATLRLRAEPARDWALHDALHVTATMAAPHVSRFRFQEGQDSVRLVVASPDDVCATVAVHAYTCPIAQSIEEIEQSTTRMTVLRSGGVQLAKARYERGFYVIALVSPTDEPCSGEEEDTSDWLWEAAILEQGNDARNNASVPRTKLLTYEIKPSLSRREYLVGAGATLGFFLLFYVLFGALVLAERWPRWYNLVGPRAKLQHPHPHGSEAGVMTELESTANDGVSRAVGAVGASGAAGRRRRRDSTATFDGSDASDSDSDGDGTNDTVTTAVDASPGTVSPRATSPGATTPNVTSPDALSPGTPSPDTLSSSPDAPDSPEVHANGVHPEMPDANGQIATVEILNEVDGAARTAEQVRDGGAGRGARPFGLPARLHVAALARRRERVLRARSQRYLYTLYTVAVFYALPVVQFVAAFQLILNVSGSLDLCYYNFLCLHPLGALSDFNHVFSNLGYLLLGALYMLQLRRRKMRRKRQPRDEEYGIPAHYGLASSLGAGMMVVALLSASYHVCPNRLNFQFDTSFMYVLAVLSMVKIYQSRHPDINARAHATFAVLAVLIALVVWGVLGGGPLFWSVFTVLHVFTFLLLSLRIYYVGQFRLEKESLAEAARALGARPLYMARLLALLLANAVNWTFALVGLLQQSGDIASHLLFVLLCNALLYMVFYLCMKLLHGERPRWYAWLYLGGAALAWAPALYYFTAGTTDWSATAARSRIGNHECRLLAFYDAHDLWHMLSAVALYFTFNAMLTWDDGLAAVKRTEIAVF